MMAASSVEVNPSLVSPRSKRAAIVNAIANVIAFTDEQERPERHDDQREREQRQDGPHGRVEHTDDERDEGQVGHGSVRVESDAIDELGGRPTGQRPSRARAAPSSSSIPLIRLRREVADDVGPGRDDCAGGTPADPHDLIETLGPHLRTGRAPRRGRSRRGSRPRPERRRVPGRSDGTARWAWPRRRRSRSG